MNTNLNKDLSSDKVCVKYFTNITKYSSGHGPNRSVSLKDWTGSKIVTMVLTSQAGTPKIVWLFLQETYQSWLSFNAKVNEHQINQFFAIFLV